MDKYFKGSKLYAHKNNNNTYSIYVLLSNMYEHPLLNFGMEEYTGQSYITINQILKTCNAIENLNDTNYLIFPNKYLAETCIGMLNMLRITKGK